MAEPFHHIPFEPLLDELAAKGFYFGVDSHLRLNRWLARQAVKKESMPLQTFKYSLSAILCQSETQQQIFFETFDRLYTRFLEKAESFRPDSMMPPGQVRPPIVPPQVPATEAPPPPVTSPVELPRVASSRRGPIRIELKFPASNLRVWNLKSMDEAVQPLREKEWTDTLDWDIPASIHQTIRSGGIPQFIFKKRKKAPSYLVLIEEVGPKDHLARFFQELVLELTRRDIDAEYLFYEHSPHVCWKERSNYRTYTPVERLLAEFPGSRLLIVGRPDGLLHRDSYYPSNLVLDLKDQWSRIALLNTESPTAWGLAEKALSQLFPVVPATAEGLAALLPQWETAKVLTPYYWKLEAAEAITPDPKVRRRSLDPEVITSLQRYLGPGGFKWLCATAYYPELHYELTTLFNDEAIPPEADLSEWEQNYRWWVALGRLCRLSWFRKGKMPDILREELRRKLPEADARKVRQQLLDLLQPQHNQQEPGSYAEASQLFLLVWLEAEQNDQTIDLSRVTALNIQPGDVEDALGRKIWLEQLQAEQPPTAGSYEIPESDYSNVQQEQPAQPQQELRSQGFIALMRKAKNFSEAIEVFERMKLEDVSPDLGFFNEMMGKISHPEHAYTVLGNMKSEGIHPNEATFRAGILKLERLDDATKMFGDMRREGIVATNLTAVPLLEKAANFEEARSVFNHIRELGNLKPGLETYTVLLKKTTGFSEAGAVFREMRNAGIQPDKVAYTTWLSKSPDYDSARSVFNEMKRERIIPDSVAYTTLLDKTENFRQARSAFEEMEKDGIKHNRGMFTQLMKRATMEEEADWVEAQMRKAGIGDGTIARTRAQFKKTKPPETPPPTAPETQEQLAAMKRGWREMLSQAREEEVLKTLNSLLNEGRPLFKEVILLQARYNELNKARQLATISNEAATLEMNRLKGSILNLIDQLALEDVINSPQNQSYQQSKTGFAMVHFPKSMVVGREERFTVRMAYDEQALFEDFEKTAETRVHSVRLSDVMSAEWLDPEGGNYRIRTIHEREQFVEKTDFTEWVFFVTPEKAGSFSLVLRVSALEMAGGKQQQKSIVWEDAIQVVAGTASSKAEFQSTGETLSYEEPTAENKRIKIFLSYARQDRQFIDLLQKELSTWSQRYNLDIWTPDSLQAGQAWQSEIQKQIAQSDMVVALVSADYLVSQDFENVQLASVSGKLIVPVILRPCEWRQTFLGEIQVLPRDGQPITTRKDQEQVLVEISQDLGRLIESQGQRNNMAS